MRVIVTGATGTIGRAVAGALAARGDTVTALSRDPNAARRKLPGAGIEVAAWERPTATPPPSAALSGGDAVIHLLGEPIAQRWSQRVKAEIRASRLLSTRALAKALRDLPEAERPRVLVSQSATGFYGPRDEQPLDETSPPGKDWLSQLVVAWEAEAMAAADVTRVAVTRTGVVLSASGGALDRMLPFFKAGIGGPVAGGKQYLPWIHLDDVVGGLLKCLDDPAAEGPVNLTAPNPVTNAEFSKALGKALHRPAVAPVPRFAIKALFGEMAMIVTTGQNVRPSRLGLLEYQFRHPELLPALTDVLG
ncbi:MAG: TIGR01777 family oxidoreductase [Solirubrobacteraceae bacterium]